MQSYFTLQRNQTTLPPKGSRFISVYATTPKLSLLGEEVQHCYLKGVHVRASIVSSGELVDKKLRLDTWMEREEYTRKIVRVATLQKWEGTQDAESEQLSRVAGPGRIMPPASHFINVCAASPFFRTLELQIYQKDLHESPWTEQCFMSVNADILVDEHEIREGSFIRLFDPTLFQATQGADAPVLFGIVSYFIGFTSTHVVALVEIISFFRFGRLMSYSSGEVIHSSLRLKEQTIVLLDRSRCRFDSVATLEFNSIDTEFAHTHTYFRQEGLMAWGPKREWPEKEGWVRELEKRPEDRDSEGRKKVWGRKKVEIRRV